MSTTALKEAFLRVNIESCEERLTEIAVRAIGNNGTDTRATIDEIWVSVRKNLGLMVTLFDLEKERTIGALIYRTRGKISAKSGRGEIRGSIERKAADAVNALMASDRKIRDQEKEDERAAQTKADLEYQERLAAWKRSAIGNLTVGDKPIWQVSAGSARTWLASQRVRWRAVELLIEGIPDDGRPIEYYRKPDEVEAAFRLAQGETK